MKVCVRVSGMHYVIWGQKDGNISKILLSHRDIFSPYETKLLLNHTVMSRFSVSVRV